MAYQPYYGNDELDEQERRRRQLIAQGLQQGQDLAAIAGTVFNDRMQGFQTGLQDRMQQARAFMPGEQEPAEIKQAVAPVTPDQLQQPPQPTPTPQPQTQAIQMPPGPQGLPLPQQVAGPAMLPPPPGTPQQEQPATWQRDFEKANLQDMDTVMQLAARKDLPPDARQFMRDMVVKLHKKEIDSQSASDVIMRFAQGDKDAVNTVMKDLRRPNEGSYLKAILFARLGLNDLAAEQQRMLMQDDVKVASMQMDGKNYTVETDAKTGQVRRAWDSTGTRMGTDMLAKLSAGGQKSGGQRYSTTGGSQVIPEGEPNAGEAYSQVFDSVTGTFKNLITTGPSAGQVYTGKLGIDKRVNTQNMIALNAAAIKFQTEPTIAAATEMMKLAGQVDRGDNAVLNQTMARINNISPQIFKQMTQPGGALSAGGAEPAPATIPQATGTTVQTVRPPQVSGGVAVPAAPAVPAVPAAGQSLLEQRAQQENAAAIARRQAEEDIAVASAARREVATEAGKEIARSYDTQKMVKDIDNAEQLLISDKHYIGPIVSGIVGRGVIARRVGEQLETQADTNTKLIMGVVDRLATDGLNTLGHNPSKQDLEFWIKSKPQERSSPQFMLQWIRSRREALEGRLKYAEQQMQAGGRAPAAQRLTREKKRDVIKLD